MRALPQFGFHRSNCQQLGWHFLLAVFIGVSLRLTTFKEATTIASQLNDYKAKTSFLVSFGFTKAVSNLLVGRLSDHYGRKLPHAIGWGFGVLLGCILLTTTTSSSSWGTYVVANMCLGAQQGWTWTTNIFLWMDILGPENRALASGISNSMGYLTSAVTTYAAAALTTKQAFGLVLGTCGLGLLVSVFLVNDTTEFVALETKTSTTHVHHPGILIQQEMVECQYKDDDDEEGNGANGTTIDKQESTASSEESQPSPYDQACFVESGDENPEPIQKTSSFGTVFQETCWYNPSAAVLCWGGLTANLVTSVAWGLVLIWGQQQQLTSLQLAHIGSAFTLTKGLAMIVSGYCSDRFDRRKSVLVAGFLAAALGLLVTATADGTDATSVFGRLLLGGMVIGSGIGSVYCVLTAGLSDHTPPQDRASAIGVYKLWRDSGYAFGGLLTGWIADASGGSFVTTTTVVAGLVMVLVLCILTFYKEVSRTAVSFERIGQSP